MVRRIVCCREIYECCTGNHTSLVTIFDLLSQVKQLAGALFFLGRNPACSLIKCCSRRGITLFSIIRSYNLYVWHNRDIGLWNRRVFPGFNMAVIFDRLQSFGILFSVRHLLSIVSSGF